MKISFYKDIYGGVGCLIYLASGLMQAIMIAYALTGWTQLPWLLTLILGVAVGFFPFLGSLAAIYAALECNWHWGSALLLFGWQFWLLAFQIILSIYMTIRDNLKANSR